MRAHFVELDPAMILVKRGTPSPDEATVAALMESMSAIGLINPITVWRPSGVMPQVVAGRHRLEAAKRLGWGGIQCNDLGFDTLAEADTAETIEIVENVHRRELPQAERDRLIRRYVELRSEEVSAPQEPKPKGGRPVAAASVVARELGVTKGAVNKAIARDKARQEPQPAAPRLRDAAPAVPSSKARALLKQAALLSTQDKQWLKAHLA